MSSLLPKFFAWYYIDSISGLLSAWKNFLLFNLEFFSVPLLLKSLFSPWRRIYSPYGKTFELWKNIEAFTLNMMSRIIGAILRVFLIVIGLIFEIVVLTAGLIIILLWLALPLILTAGFLFGFKLLFF